MKPSIFDGDGRKKVQPVNVPPGTRPTSLTRSQGRTLVALFNVRGVSYHSPAGATVWVSVTHCIEQGIPYTVERQSIAEGSTYLVYRNDCVPQKEVAIPTFTFDVIKESDENC